ncbi:MAG TPA: BMP family ABC transporter substrate-binding protein [Candidatus Limnocylindrales bacterium]|nr:BMP family ABC transporter substrate-binding protein [Candidatus Limnocylindrales bacterium]
MRLKFLGVAAAVLMVAIACGGSTTGGGTTKQYKIGLVTDIGGLNDKSFNHLAYVGLEKAKTDFGILDSVTESHSGNDYVPNLTNFASKNYDLVIGVGFLMQEAMGTVSGTFPNTHFAIIDGAGTDSTGKDLQHPNVQSLYFKEQDAGAMVGVMAGWLEKNGQAKKNKHVVSAVGGVSIPPVNHYIAGFKWAAKMEDPSIKVEVGYSNDFTDPAKCSGVAKTQINDGSDVLFQVAGGCGLGVLQSAGQAGVYSVGVDADQKDADPSVIASALKKVDVATYTAIQNVVKGQFTAGALTFSIQNGGAGYAVDNFTVPAALQTELNSIQDKIKSGALTPPADIPA